MIVVDASVLVDALVADDVRGAWAREQLAEDRAWSAPDYLPVEVFSAVRGLCLGGAVTPERGAAAVDALTRVHLDLADARQLLPAMWRLRDAVGAFDAGYLALAVARRCPLVTADLRLARAADRWCQVVTPEAG